MISYYCPDHPPYGKERRQRIKDWFNHPDNVDGRIAVNCKYRPQLKSDPDFTKLIKSGFLVRVREGRYGKHQWKYAGKRTTYLIKAPNGNT